MSMCTHTQALEGVVVLSRSGLLKGDGGTERKDSGSVGDSLLVATAGDKGIYSTSSIESV